MKDNMETILIVGGVAVGLYFLSKTFGVFKANPENVETRQENKTERTQIIQDARTERQENRQDFWKDVLGTNNNKVSTKDIVLKVKPSVSTSSWNNVQTQSVMSNRGKNLIESSGYGATNYDALGQGISTQYTAKNQAVTKGSTAPKKSLLGSALNTTATGRIVNAISLLTKKKTA